MTSNIGITGRRVLRAFRLNEDIAAFLVAIGIVLACLAAWDSGYLDLFADIFCITCCIVIYGFALNTASFNGDPSVRFLAPSFAFVALLETASALAGYGPRGGGEAMALFLRVSAGWYLAFAFFFMSMVQRRGMRVKATWLVFFIVTFILAAAGATRALPPPRGTGEYLAFALSNIGFSWILLAVSAFRLSRSFPTGRYRRRLSAACFLAAVSIPAVFLPASSSWFLIFLGEYFRIAAFFLIYKAVVSQVLMKPYRSMFREMRREGGKLKTENRELNLALEEKMGLLREVHHRIKNNLQIIASLLDLADGESQDARAKGALRDSQERVRSVALVHEMLYRSPEASSVDIAAYVGRLVAGICGSVSHSPHIDLDLAEVSLPLERILPMGMALNELLTNAVKYSGGMSAPAAIRVRLAMEGGHGGGREVVLEVSDNGPGLPQGFNPGTSGSLGFSLVSSLAAQLGGTVSWSGLGGVPAGQGLTVRLAFPEAEEG